MLVVKIIPVPIHEARARPWSCHAFCAHCAAAKQCARRRAPDAAPTRSTNPPVSFFRKQHQGRDHRSTVATSAAAPAASANITIVEYTENTVEPRTGSARQPPVKAQCRVLGTYLPRMERVLMQTWIRQSGDGPRSQQSRFASIRVPSAGHSRANACMSPIV